MQTYLRRRVGKTFSRLERLRYWFYFTFKLCQLESLAPSLHNHNFFLPMPPKFYSPLQQIDEECVEKLLPVECRDDYTGIPEQSRYSLKRKFWSKYWAWFTHGALVCSSTMLFILLIQARSQPIKFPVYCKLIILDVEDPVI